MFNFSFRSPYDVVKVGCCGGPGRVAENRFVDALHGFDLAGLHKGSFWQAVKIQHVHLSSGVVVFFVHEDGVATQHGLVVRVEDFRAEVAEFRVALSVYKSQAEVVRAEVVPIGHIAPAASLCAGLQSAVGGTNAERQFHDGLFAIDEVGVGPSGLGYACIDPTEAIFSCRTCFGIPRGGARNIGPLLVGPQVVIAKPAALRSWDQCELGLIGNGHELSSSALLCGLSRREPAGVDVVGNEVQGAVRLGQEAPSRGHLRCAAIRQSQGVGGGLQCGHGLEGDIHFEGVVLRNSPESRCNVDVAQAIAIHVNAVVVFVANPIVVCVFSTIIVFGIGIHGALVGEGAGHHHGVVERRDVQSNGVMGRFEILIVDDHQRNLICSVVVGVGAVIVGQAERLPVDQGGVHEDSCTMGTIGYADIFCGESIEVFNQHGAADDRVLIPRDGLLSGNNGIAIIDRHNGQVEPNLHGMSISIGHGESNGVSVQSGHDLRMRGEILGGDVLLLNPQVSIELE